MRVTYEYTAAWTQELPGGTLESPALLSIFLRWEPPPADQDDFEIVMINQSVIATIYSDPTRLRSIEGVVRDPQSWELAPQLIGEELWRIVDSPPALTVESHEVVIDAESLDGLRAAWAELLAAERSGTLKVLPRRPSELEDEQFELITSDPNFFDDGLDLLRTLFGDEAVERMTPKPSTD